MLDMLYVGGLPSWKWGTSGDLSFSSSKWWGSEDEDDFPATRIIDGRFIIEGDDRRLGVIDSGRLESDPSMHYETWLVLLNDFEAVLAGKIAPSLSRLSAAEKLRLFATWAPDLLEIGNREINSTVPLPEHTSSYLKFMLEANDTLSEELSNKVKKSIILERLKQIWPEGELDAWTENKVDRMATFLRQTEAGKGGNRKMNRPD